MFGARTLSISLTRGRPWFARGSKAPERPGPWTWSGAVMFADSRQATGNGTYVLSNPDRVVPARIYTANATNSRKWFWGTLPARWLRQGNTASFPSDECTYVDAVGDTVSATIGNLSTWTVCFRVNVTWSTMTAIVGGTLINGICVYDAGNTIRKVWQFHKQVTSWRLTYIRNATLGEQYIFPSQPADGWCTIQFRANASGKNMWFNAAQVHTTATVDTALASCTRLTICGPQMASGGWLALYNRYLSDAELSLWHTQAAAVFS